MIHNAIQTLRKHAVGAVIAAVILVAVIMTVVASGGQRATLPAYTGRGEVPVAGPSPTVAPKFDAPMTTYVNGEAGLSMLVPAEWQRITQDGYPTFVHAGSGASLQVRILPYDPSVAAASAETAAATVAASGGVLLGFDYLSNAGYETRWQMQETRVYDHIERVYYDRQTMICLLCVFDDETWQVLRPYYEAIFDSFSWHAADPVPAGTFLVHVTDWNCEIGCPEGWTTGFSDGAAVFASPDAPASIALTAYASDTNPASMSQTDIVGLVGNGREGFVLSGIEASGNVVWCQSVGRLGDATMQYLDLLVQSQGRLFHAVASWQGEAVSENLMRMCLALFRTF